MKRSSDSDIGLYIVAGELARFQTGVTMEISRIDAWYSCKDVSLEGPASYIVRGLCCRCCIPELILRHMQACSLFFTDQIFS